MNRGAKVKTSLDPGIAPNIVNIHFFLCVLNDETENLVKIDFRDLLRGAWKFCLGYGKVVR